MNLAPLLGLGGPVVVLIVFRLLFWRGLRHLWLRAIFIYLFAVVSGILSDAIWHVGVEVSAFIAGILAPLFYCAVFTLLSAGTRSSVSRVSMPVPSGAAEKSGLSPTIVAAIIQAIATIIVAFIARS